MYPINSTVKTMFDSNYRQVVRINMDTVGGSSYTLTENDIISGSFSIDRYSMTGNRIEVGSAVAGECTFKIKNYDGDWDDVTFEGAHLYVRIGICDWDNYTDENDIQFIPCGWFTIDKPVKSASVLSVDALDRMARLDKKVNVSAMSGTYTPRLMVNFVCTQCNVVLANGSELASLPNADYAMAIPDNIADLTYRNLLQSACMLMGVCAFFDWSGSLRIKWYSAPSTTISIDESKRYSHTMAENNITITGVVYSYADDDRVLHESLYGTKDYAIDISNNNFVNRDTADSAVQALGPALTGFSYRPISAQIKPSPYLYPLDMITFVKNEQNFTSIISNVTFGVNATTAIEGRGVTNEDNGYATYGDYTAVQTTIIERAKTQVNQLVNERTALLLNMNEMVMNSLGLYATEVQSGGSTVYYFHDQPTLADSSIIYTMTANGLAWTNDWNDGDPVWQYGITRDGNAILNILNAYKISADIITTGTMYAVNLVFGEAPNTTELRTNDAEDGAIFDGTGKMQFSTVGEFNAKNMVSGGGTANQLLMSYSSTTRSALLRNYQVANTSYVANSVQLMVGSSDHSITLTNLDLGYNRYANRIALTASATTHTIALYNYQTGTSNVIANQIGSTSSSSNGNTITLTNNDSSGVKSNEIVLTGSSTARSLDLRNYNSAGTTIRSRFLMQDDGSVRLQTTTGGTSWLYFDYSGNVTLQANNSLNLVSENYYVVVSTNGTSHKVKWQTIGSYTYLVSAD